MARGFRLGGTVSREKVGEDPTIEDGARVSLTEGLLADIAQKAAPKLVEDASSGIVAGGTRRKRRRRFRNHSWMGVPLRKDDQVLGVVEIVNKADGTAFNEEDLFFLASISEQAAVALHNANLLEAERKVSALDALLKISQEITFDSGSGSRAVDGGASGVVRGAV